MIKERIHIGSIVGSLRLIVVEGGSWAVWEPNLSLKMSPGEQLDAAFAFDPNFQIAKFKAHKTMRLI